MGLAGRKPTNVTSFNFSYYSAHIQSEKFIFFFILMAFYDNDE